MKKKMRNEMKSANQFGGKPKFFFRQRRTPMFYFGVIFIFTLVLLSLSTLHAALSCDSCHKGPPYGPVYVSSPTINKWNSHIAHTSAPYSYTCDICHPDTVRYETAGDSYTIVYATNHVNSKIDVRPKLVDYNFTYSTAYAVGQSTCSDVVCHGNRSTVWGESRCYDCHSSTTDLDDYFLKNNIIAIISTDSVQGWFGSGHGLASGSKYYSGRPGAGFGGSDGCKYCHDGTNYAHDYSTGPNFFRLANTTQTVYNAFGDPKNGNCLVCHSTVTDGGYLGKNATVTKSTFTAHWTSTHTIEGANTDGGKFCWDCHDPHGDWNVTYSTPFARMFQALVVDLTAGTDANNYGAPAGTQTLTRFDFSTGTTKTTWDRETYVSSHTFLFACQSCHDSSVEWFSRSTWTPSATGTIRHSTTTASCTTCHPHKENFKPVGGCVNCHTLSQASRRAIAGEFKLSWTHMLSSTPTAKMVQDNDCVICHMEGDLDLKINDSYHREFKKSQGVSTTTPVGTFAGFIQLRDPDTNAQIQFSTWNGRIAGIAGSTWTRGGYKDWSVDETGYLYKVEAGSFSFVKFTRSISTNVLEAWVTSVQNNLCLKCHDETGGLGVDPADPTRPFYSSTGVVVDVSTQLATVNASYHPVIGPQNNPFCDSHTLLAPWAAITKSTWGTSGWGQLISCWDCHIATATAHGNPVTLRATNLNYNVTTDLVAAGPNPFCTACHRDTIYGGGTEVVGRSAFRGNAEPGESHIVRHYDETPMRCGSCHGSSWFDPGRRIRAQDAHGFNLIFSTAQATTGIPTGSPTLATYVDGGVRPFCFLRNTANKDTATPYYMTGWRPRNVAGTGYTPGCYFRGSNSTDACDDGQHETTYPGWEPYNVPGYGGWYSHATPPP